MKEAKFTVYYKLDGQIWTVQVDPIYEEITEEEFNNRPKYKYFQETLNGYIKCDKK